MSGSFPEASSKPILSNRSYDILKQTSAVILPAINALFYALAQIWHIPNSNEVIGTIAAVNVFAGALMKLSTKSYNKSDAKYIGDIRVENSEDDMMTRYSLNLNGSPETLETLKEVTFKVVNDKDI